MMRRMIGTAGAAVVVGVLALADPSHAATSTEVVQGQYVRLVSVVDWSQAEQLQPGEAVQWDVDVSAEAPEPGTLAVGLSASGETPLTIDAELCEVAWRNDGCPSGAERLRTAWEIPRDGELVVLSEGSAADVAHVRLHVALASDNAADPTQVRVHAIGAGEEIGTGPKSPLAPTGSSPGVPWMLAGGSALLVGTAALLLARARTRKGES